MISAEEALRLVLENTVDVGTEIVDLLKSTGRILAQDVLADRDFPPFDRVMMDGISLQFSTFKKGVRTFPIEKIQAAGAAQQILENDKNCIEVMTGAILPVNTNTVIPYEQCEISEGQATIIIGDAVPMQNIHRKGVDCSSGELLINKGEEITPAIIGIMATVGLSKVEVRRMAKVVICSTGDELIDINDKPELHQMRRSNVYMLAAALQNEGIFASTIHLPDHAETMIEGIRELLGVNDVIMLSGAVSKGKFDFLPEVLAQLGMEKIFHQVAQRPGKPFLFGRFTNGPVIFGFPGNPVSTFVCFHQFFKPWLHSSIHFSSKKRYAHLVTNVHFKPALTNHLLVKITDEKGQSIATPLSGSGSGDLITLTKAEGIICLPPDRSEFNKGEAFELNIL